MTNSSKLPYEPPQIIDLSGRDAYAADLESKKQCKSGSIAQVLCKNGTVVREGGQNCMSGGSPQASCSGGNTALGASCYKGTVPATQCMYGVSFYTPIVCSGGASPA